MAQNNTNTPMLQNFLVSKTISTSQLFNEIHEINTILIPLLGIFSNDKRLLSKQIFDSIDTILRCFNHAYIESNKNQKIQYIEKAEFELIMLGGYIQDSVKLRIPSIISHEVEINLHLGNIDYGLKNWKASLKPSKQIKP